MKKVLKKLYWRLYLKPKLTWVYLIALISIAFVILFGNFLIKETTSLQEGLLNGQLPLTFEEEDKGEDNEEEKEETGMILVGMASWYDYDLRRADQRCLTDDCYSMFHPTCASRDFPRGTILKVTSLVSDQSVNCVVNDYVENKDVIIDLSSYAFRQIGQLKSGLVEVKIIKAYE